MCVMAGRADRCVSERGNRRTAASTHLPPISNHAVWRHDKLFTATTGSLIDDPSIR